MPGTGDNRDAEVSALLVGAIDLHCHSGPAAMPRILDHHEALMDCANAKFSALLYKDHFYLGCAHAIILEKLFPDTGVKLFSGIATNESPPGGPAIAVRCGSKAGPIPPAGMRCVVSDPVEMMRVLSIRL